MRVCITVRVPAGPSVRVCVVMARRREVVHLPIIVAAKTERPMGYRTQQYPVDR
jgi:hypothetical protein